MSSPELPDLSGSYQRGERQQSFSTEPGTLRQREAKTCPWLVFAVTSASQKRIVHKAMDSSQFMNALAKLAARGLLYSMGEYSKLCAAWLRSVDENFPCPLSHATHTGISLLLCLFAASPIFLRRLGCFPGADFASKKSHLA